MARTLNPTADTPRGTQTRCGRFPTGLSWKRTTSVLRPAAYAVVAMVLNFLLATAFSHDYVAGTIS